MRVGQRLVIQMVIDRLKRVGADGPTESQLRAVLARTHKWAVWLDVNGVRHVSHWDIRRRKSKFAGKVIWQGMAGGFQEASLMAQRLEAMRERRKR